MTKKRWKELERRAAAKGMTVPEMFEKLRIDSLEGLDNMSQAEKLCQIVALTNILTNEAGANKLKHSRE
jgi:hypothetical protein